MAFEIVWTRCTIEGYERIISYLGENFTDRKIINFVSTTHKFFETLQEYPDLLRKTSHQKHVHRGPINPLTILTYRIKPGKKQIELINIRGARQKPLY